LSDSGVLSLGNSTSTSPIQNTMRSKKNISRPRPPFSIELRLIPSFELAAVDKSQVFALKLNRRKFAENSNHLIRCKFSIDADFRWPERRSGRIHHFETIPEWRWKPRVHHPD
jgi:hypothetical protein